MTLLVGQYEASTGSRTAAIKLVSEMSRDMALPVNDSTDYNAVCATALAKVRGKAGVGVRRLHQWCIDADKCETPTERLLALAPQKQGQPVIKPTRMEWLPEIGRAHV